MRRLQFLVLLALVWNCTEKNEFHEGLSLVWQAKEIEWNPSSLKQAQNFIYGHTMNDSVFKLDFLNGKLIWKRYSRGSYQTLNPEITDDFIIVGGADKLKAFNKNGDLIWSKKTNTKTIGLVILDSLIINTRTGQGLFADQIKDGKNVWNIKPDYQMLSMTSPTILDSLLVIGDFDYKENIGKHLTCIDLREQKIRWQIENRGFINSKALIRNGEVFFNSDSFFRKGYTLKVNLSNGKPIWKTKTYPLVSPPPVITEDNIIVPSYRNGIISLDTKSGEPQWKLEKNYTPNTNILIHRNTLYFGTESRELIGVDANGKIVFKSKFEYGLGNPFVNRGNLYVNDGNNRLFKIENTSTGKELN